MPEISYLIIILLLIIYILFLHSKVSRLQSKGSAFTAVNIDFKLEDEIRAMVEQGKSQVEVIRFVREASGLDLLQAKLYVDRIVKSPESE